MGRDGTLYTFIPENFWTKVGLKIFFSIPSISKNFLVFVECSFRLHKKKFHNRNILKFLLVIIFGIITKNWPLYARLSYMQAGRSKFEGE